MRRYETTYIVDSAIEPDKIEAINQRALEIIAKYEGKIIEEKRWGKRRLAFEIDKRQYGYYIILNYEAQGAVVSELERFFHLNSNVLRYLTIQLNNKDLKLMAEDQERKRLEEEKALAAAQALNKSEE
jgi:small subunit ribosomal protein S6